MQEKSFVVFLVAAAASAADVIFTSICAQKFKNVCA
jgi:hypothetical protein